MFFAGGCTLNGKASADLYCLDLKGTLHVLRLCHVLDILHIFLTSHKKVGRGRLQLLLSLIYDHCGTGNIGIHFFLFTSKTLYWVELQYRVVSPERLLVALILKGQNKFFFSACLRALFILNMLNRIGTDVMILGLFFNDCCCY